MADDGKNPDILELINGFERRGAHQTATLGRNDESIFFRCYTIIMEQDIEWVQQQLWKLGQWPYERIAVRVLGWEEAVTRLKSDEQSMCAMTRMFVAIEDPDEKLYLVRTPDLVAGKRDAHQAPKEANVREAVDAAFKLN